MPSLREHNENYSNNNGQRRGKEDSQAPDENREVSAGMEGRDGWLKYNLFVNMTMYRGDTSEDVFCLWEVNGSMIF
jgi:hypothetical protein